MVDEDGMFTELAGPELQNLSVMTEGTDKGTTENWDSSAFHILNIFNISRTFVCDCACVSDFHAEGVWSFGERGAVCSQLPI